MSLKNVIVLGSSIPLGVGDSSSGTPTRQYGWPSRAANAGAFPQNFALTNYGCSGDAGYLWSQSPDLGGYRQSMLSGADTVILQYGANEILDTTNGPLSLAQMQAEFNTLVGYCHDAGVPRVIGVTLGMLGSGTLQALTPGNESGQTVNANQASTITPWDNWLTSGQSNADWVLDVRLALQLGGQNGTPGKWQTFPACFSGTVGTGSTSTTIVDSGSNLELLNSSAPFPQANAAQYQYQGCIIAWTHLGTTVYNYVSPSNLSLAAGTLTMANGWGGTNPQSGDPYIAYPCPNNNADYTHYSPWGHKLVAALYNNYAPINGGY